MKNPLVFAIAHALICQLQTSNTHWNEIIPYLIVPCFMQANCSIKKQISFEIWQKAVLYP